MECRVCGNSNNNKAYQVKEMMFGFKDNFSYYQCSECDCLQIAQIPENISKYYPENYYSFSGGIKKENFIKRFIRNKRNEYAVFSRGIIGKFLIKYFPDATFRLLSNFPLKKNSRVLDVGCGGGLFLNYLANIGFTNLTGADPFIADDISYDVVKIYKQSIHQIQGEWDLIMFHHSFEHISDPLETLKSVAGRLTQNGHCLIRIPVASGYAWEHYRENWVQLDAPRHFFLHTKKSMEKLVAGAGLKIKEIVYDSTDFQFWGSEQYIKGIPLFDEKSYAVNPSASIFSKEEIHSFKEKAVQLNNKNRGDMCAFIISK
ncbi:class I SAM-dependent methyltransferase [Flavobacterium rhizosphaerae]|uniref:Class I SAM-dependent methyltransferase n=1 Tax=Flavobacterium rhizosphaerae TaxID=3163298 RepID=A0ABW8YVM0_9FLAO